ncbi:MAG: hypothetical protein NTV01_19545, partial [Bacteroidia bacterium]|nr:hypothetical protein [Bacteroidia bacterium]
MKKLSILLYFFLLSLCTFAQEVLYEETFDMKNEAWVSTDSSAVEEYKNGKLLLHGQPGEKAVAVLREVILDPLKDFSIRCRITYDHGDTENSFGMVLVDDRFTGKSSWYYLMVYPRDYYRVSCSKGINLELNDYLPKQKKAGIMRASGEYNDLELRNAGDVFEFYINDQKVWRKEYPDICITRIGLFSEGDQEIQVDDLVIKQNGWNSIHLVDDSLKSYKKENLGENINSTASELLPIISADGQTLYLCVDGDTNNIGINYKQDIWYSTLNPDKTWSKRVNMGFPLNNESPNGVCYVSPDNNTLLLNGLYDATGKTIGPGISLSNRQKTGWSIPVALNID